MLIDGVNVKDYSFDALYDKLGYVTLGMITVRKEIYKNDKKNETELFGLTYKY